MSKIGRMPIGITDGVTVTLSGKDIRVAGPKGNLSFIAPDGVEIVNQDGKILVSQVKDSDKDLGPVHGLTRAIIANMIEGVSKGFEKKLELSGVGYRAQATGTDLQLSVGFSHPVKITAGSGITFSVADNIITVSGIDKSLVGEWAAKVRSVRVPEPYKGKGISYKGERIRRKAGKAAKTVGAAK